MASDVYNVGDESMNYTKRELCQVVQQFVDVDVELVDKQIDIEKRDYSVSYEKIRETGYQTEIALPDAIEGMVNAVRAVPFDMEKGNY